MLTTSSSRGPTRTDALTVTLSVDPGALPGTPSVAMVGGVVGK